MINLYEILLIDVLKDIRLFKNWQTVEAAV